MELRVTYLFKEQRAVDATFPINDIDTVLSSPARFAGWAIDQLHIRNCFAHKSPCKNAALESVHVTIIMSGQQFMELQGKLPRWIYDQNGLVNLEQLIELEWKN